LDSVLRSCIALDQTAEAELAEFVRTYQQ